MKTGTGGVDRSPPWAAPGGRASEPAEEGLASVLVTTSGGGTGRGLKEDQTDPGSWGLGHSGRVGLVGERVPFSQRVRWARWRGVQGGRPGEPGVP